MQCSAQPILGAPKFFAVLSQDLSYVIVIAGHMLQCYAGDHTHLLKGSLGLVVLLLNFTVHGKHPLCTVTCYSHIELNVLHHMV